LQQEVKKKVMSNNRVRCNFSFIFRSLIKNRLKEKIVLLPDLRQRLKYNLKKGNKILLEKFLKKHIIINKALQKNLSHKKVRKMKKNFKKIASLLQSINHIYLMKAVGMRIWILP